MVYAYDCPKCGEVSIVHRPGEKVVECPHCGSPVSRIYQVSTITSARNSADPFTHRSLDRVGNGATIGDMWDYSRELSERRVQIAGKDTIKEKRIEKEIKKRGGGYHLPESS